MVLLPMGDMLVPLVVPEPQKAHPVRSEIQKKYTRPVTKKMIGSLMLSTPTGTRYILDEEGDFYA